MYAVSAVVSIIVAVAAFVHFQRVGEMPYLLVAGVFTLVGIVTGGIFFSSRVNKKDDIHITE